MGPRMPTWIDGEQPFLERAGGGVAGEGAPPSDGEAPGCGGTVSA
jgi:hypothetical protein